MKKKYLIITFILLIPQLVFASPDAAISISASSINKGDSVTATVTLKDTASWNITIVGSGAASCSTKEADVTSDAKSTTKRFDLACKSVDVGTINFTVTGDITSDTSETKDISLTKSVTVVNEKSSDNTLKELKVDNAIVSGFSSSKTSYTLSDNPGTSINISATPNDSKASVAGTGDKTLKYGKNTFNIDVTAENGSKKTYTIIVNKPDSRSKNNYLKTLSATQGDINFNKETTNYTIKVEHSINEITINATPEDSKATVSGTGKKTLKDYNNEFKVVVKAENESTKTYVINVTRKDASGSYGKLSADNSVKSINITGYEFKFNKDTKKYNLLVDEDVNELEFKVVTNDKKATVSIENNTNLKPGLNEVKVIATSENGNPNEYLFDVYKIGEVCNCEETSPEPVVCPELPTQEESNNEKNKEWQFIAIVEFVLLMILGILFIFVCIRKRKQA